MLKLLHFILSVGHCPAWRKSPMRMRRHLSAACSGWNRAPGLKRSSTRETSRVRWSGQLSNGIKLLNS